MVGLITRGICFCVDQEVYIWKSFKLCCYHVLFDVPQPVGYQYSRNVMGSIATEREIDILYSILCWRYTFTFSDQDFCKLLSLSQKNIVEIHKGTKFNKYYIALKLKLSTLLLL